MTNVVLIPRSHNTLDRMALMYGRSTIPDLLSILKHNMMLTDLGYTRPLGIVYDIPSGEEMFVYQVHTPL